MSAQSTDRSATIVPFDHTPKVRPDANIIADDSGRAIVAMLKKAAEQANDDCARAMDLAHKLTFQVRDVEERFRQIEVEAAQFRDRATRAEAWLLRIQNEIEDTFFQSKERDPQQRQRQ
jgi:chemotaxis regulatin CheY-phosphate phosphatase CheZ